MATAVDNQAALLEATAELLEEGASFAALSVQAISERAGLGRTNFYFCFKDKRALLTRLAEDAAAELFARAEAWFDGQGDGAEELGRIVGPVVELWLRHGPVLSAVVQTASVDPEVRDLWRDAGAALRGGHPPANRARAGRGPSRRRAPAGDRFRTRVDDRAHVLPARPAGRRTIPSGSPRRSRASGSARSTNAPPEGTTQPVRGLTRT